MSEHNETAYLLHASPSLAAWDTTWIIRVRKPQVAQGARANSDCVLLNA